ncbi:MAG: hypothetical protein V2J02_01530 [Pseudomonadales bacterium]|nr:hypothetical protein [Pseudomonadales bacterium]
MLDHVDLGRDDVELLAGLRADALQLGAAGAVGLLGVVFDDDAGQVVGKRLAAGATARVRRDLDALRGLVVDLDLCIGGNGLCLV